LASDVPPLAVVHLRHARRALRYELRTDLDNL
jgi:hypothetical protein